MEAKFGLELFGFLLKNPPFLKVQVKYFPKQGRAIK